VAAELHACLRCGSTDKWNIEQLLRTEDEGKIYVYQLVCNSCGRPSLYKTDNPDAIPARQRIRDELLTPERNFDSRIDPSSDTIGFSEDKLKPRLVKE
jgi:hypothetical protein